MSGQRYKKWTERQTTLYLQAMKYIGLLLIVALFGSCFSEGDCLVRATNQMYIQFKKKTNTSLDTSVYFMNVTVSGTDSIFKFSAPVTNLLLPLDIAHDTTSYIFKRINSADSTQNIPADTLIVTYNAQTKVLGKDCGAYKFYSNLNAIKVSKSLSFKAFNNFLLKDPATQNYALNYQFYF
ncbi:MAG: hypothetical protein JST43_08700 [Bacteroidetes bacterium]|nr:hypothetical protein [Bacteroidota bacterium]MBS1541407.1 hypothetical protein [Bacteroidota bacterium]